MLYHVIIFHRKGNVNEKGQRHGGLCICGGIKRADFPEGETKMSHVPEMAEIRVWGRGFLPAAKALRSPQGCGGGAASQHPAPLIFAEQKIRSEKTRRVIPPGNRFFRLLIFFRQTLFGFLSCNVAVIGVNHNLNVIIGKLIEIPDNICYGVADCGNENEDCPENTESMV